MSYIFKPSNVAIYDIPIIFPFPYLAINTIESILCVISVLTHHILPFIEFIKYVTAVKKDIYPFLFITYKEVGNNFLPSKLVFFDTLSKCYLCFILICYGSKSNTVNDKNISFE